MAAKREERIRWLAATLIALSGVLGVSAVAWFFGHVRGSELPQCAAFVAVFVALPLALYLLPLYGGDIRRTASRLRFAWTAAPFRRVKWLLLLTALLGLFIRISSEQQSHRFRFPFRGLGGEVWVSDEFVGFSRLYTAVEDIDLVTEPHPLVSNLGLSKSFEPKWGQTLVYGKWVVHRSIMFPMGPLLLLAILVPMSCLIIGGWRSRQRRGCCSFCSYNLTGNVSGVCPECGAPISNASNSSVSEAVPGRART